MINFKQYSVISLFSGCGGLDLGFKQAGFNILWANEKNKDACATYRFNFPETKLVEGDIKLIKDSEFPKNIDILIGGFPCQGFSLGGNRSLDDERNFLYKEFSRCLNVVKPKMFLAENVKGLFSMANGEVIKRIIKDFSKKNYCVFYKLYNAKQFGVPQDRERIFLIGIRKDLKIMIEFPQIEYGPGYKPYVTLKDTIWHLRDSPGEYIIANYTSRYLSRQRKRGWDSVSYCITASAKQNPLHPDGKKMKKVRKDKYSFQGHINRRMSISECLIIQSFPENYFLSGNIISRYRQVGNAVPPLLAKKIALEMKKSLNLFYIKQQYQSEIPNPHLHKAIISL